MKTLCFATANENKAKEIREMLDGKYQVLTLKDIGCHEDIPETADTIEGNAQLKARYVKEHYRIDCFSDDSGLEVEALGGEPGVISARYAGKHRDFEANIDLVLEKLKTQNNRNAQFKTCITLLLNGKEITFTGIVKGQILEARRGSNGFGYDPIFLPTGYDKTFAEMSAEEKNAISHRGRALAQMIDYLEKEAKA